MISIILNPGEYWKYFFCPAAGHLKLELGVPVTQMPPTKWYWSQICHMTDISVNFVDMLWTIPILSFDLYH